MEKIQIKYLSAEEWNLLKATDEDIVDLENAAHQAAIEARNTLIAAKIPFQAVNTDGNIVETIGTETSVVSKISKDQVDTSEAREISISINKDKLNLSA